MPKCIRDSISVGIGLFIAFIGLKNASIITGNQFTLDAENNVFAFLGSNRTNNRVANISGFDKSKIKHFPNGKETILIGNKEYINSSTYSSKRDEALRCTLKLSLSYLFLEYYINTLENEIDLTGTYSRHI